VADLFKICLVNALDEGKAGQLEEHCLEIGLMGTADTEVLSRAAANPAPGFMENLDGRVNFPHPGFVGGIPRNAKFIVQGPQTAGRAAKTILVELTQREGDFARGLCLGALCSPAPQRDQVQAEEEAYQESNALPYHIFFPKRLGERAASAIILPSSSPFNSNAVH
jgi:hypothetical protein